MLESWRLTEDLNVTDGILFFYDEGCAHCVTQQRAVESVTAQLAGTLPVYQINVYQQPQVARTWGVTSTPTLILVQAGQAVATYTHDLDAAQLRTVIHYYFGGIKMAEEKSESTETLHMVTGGSSLSTGVCGPDGCEIDWNQAATKPTTQKKQAAHDHD